MNKIIERLEAIAGGDPWKMRDTLRIFIDELKEKRDIALEEKKEVEKAASDIVNEDEPIIPQTQEEMIELGKELVAEHFPV